MTDYSPKFTPGNDIPLTASSAIVGGQLVVVSGSNTVAPSTGASATWLGIARQDAAVGARVTVTRGGVQKPIASGAIAAGDRVAPAAAGRVASAATSLQTVGTALTAAADGAPVVVAFDR